MRANTNRRRVASRVAVLLMVAGSAWAQRPTPPLLPVPDSVHRAENRQFVHLPADNSGPPVLRRPAAERLNELRAQREFRYVEPEEAPSSSSNAWTRFWRQLMRWLEGIFTGEGYENRGRFLVYALFGLAFIYVLLRVLRLDVTGLFGRRSRTLPLPYETAPEDIHAIDFDAALAQAEDAGNHRLAVRLGYLLVLRHLTEQGLIRWQPDKTNQQYVQELAGTAYAADFRELTRQFEYVWYGELPVTASDYPALRASRQNFIRSLTRRAA
ncbi:DUF4129 domain-containing protein [Hymenobacter pini]|uniref:DUF4129 domain-containing protein n=1 Tax=Hymenobacter pini TaxID=2880879 RepID=UPI001CF282BB|nr:DUF4129 domain-containing protein [Hymenobacter pini]MCA8831270.1 DUF4129 domain-containing protein [Hymenobacter pini]